MSRAKAFVYAACEDFGIALVEAQACGTPVIAYQGGGALETVIDIRQQSAQAKDQIPGQATSQATGIFFFPQTAAALIDAVETFSQIFYSINPESCRLQAAKFTPKIFESSYLGFLEDCFRDFPPESSIK
jgi:glycosyltransferase involved in cell wall biosynthesis